MSRNIRFNVSDATARILDAEADRRGQTVERFLRDAIIDIQLELHRARRLTEATARTVQCRTADPPKTALATPARRWRVDYAAVDAFLETAGIPIDRRGR